MIIDINGVVFPAYAGMFRRKDQPKGLVPCFPRIRGDVPALSDAKLRIYEFSPHTRGCSWLMGDGFCPLPVFPAYAGMFLQSLGATFDSVGFPRIRGDVP